MKDTLLAIRFSSVGDVAMTLPVLYSLSQEYPDCRILFLSDRIYQPLFRNSPENLIFVGADLKGKHKGIKGLTRLYHQLSCYSITGVADLHQVLRSQYLTLRFWLAKVPVARIDKGRKEKRALCRRRHKTDRPLFSTFERYRSVFKQLDYPFPFRFTSIFSEEPAPLQDIASLIPEKGKDRWIGIAPYARHKGKIYPLEKMERVVAALSEKEGVQIFLFGHGSEEENAMRQWAEKYPRTLSFVNQSSMFSELSLISHLDVMLSMDSANMHLASLVNTPVVSVWGATSPKTGFLGWRQKEENCIQLPLPCRPCSVYGNKPCYLKDYRCLAIPPQDIAAKILAVIS